MKTRLDIHNYEGRLNTTLRRLEKSNISEANKKVILRFKDELVIEGLSKARIERYVGILLLVAKHVKKDYEEMTAEDIKRYVCYLQQKEDYSPWTKQFYKVVIKRLYKWLRPMDDGDYPPEVKWISLRVSRSEKKLPGEGELITQEELKKVVDAAQTVRDKTFISVLYESGCRISEIGTLRIKDVSSDNDGILLRVQGKTGSRKIRLVFSLFLLNSWLSVHPLKDEPDSPLWISESKDNRDKPLCYAGIRKVINKAFEKSGVQKKSNPHFLRHSRATQMANYLTEFQMNQYFGWVQGSDMPSVYVHLSGRETNSAILEMNGIKSDEKDNSDELKPLQCPRCNYINPLASKFCIQCGIVLDEVARMNMELKTQKETAKDIMTDRVLNKLLTDPDVVALIREKLVGG